MAVSYLESFESMLSSTWRPLYSRCEYDPEVAGSLDRFERVINIPTLVDGYEVLLAVVAWPAAHGRGTVAKVTAAGSHAVAWRVAFGTETVGYLKLAIFALRAIE